MSEMRKMLGLHLLMLLLIPIIWHMVTHGTWHLPGPAGSEPQGAPLSDVEQDYYDTIFAYVMQNISAGKDYNWQVGKSFGNIKAGPPFMSQSGSFCRPYAEAYMVNGVEGSAEGYACRRAEDNEDKPSWCKLRSGEALTCAMERRGFFDSISGALR